MRYRGGELARERERGEGEKIKENGDDEEGKGMKRRRKERVRRGGLGRRLFVLIINIYNIDIYSKKGYG